MSSYGRTQSRTLTSRMSLRTPRRRTPSSHRTPSRRTPSRHSRSGYGSGYGGGSVFSTPRSAYRSAPRPAYRASHRTSPYDIYAGYSPRDANRQMSKRPWM